MTRQIRTMTPDEWRAAVSEHEARVEPHLAPHLARRKEQRKHPVEDFLFVYYSNSPGKLRRWHPGAGVALLPDDDGRTPISEQRFTTRVMTANGEADLVDTGAVVEVRERTIGFVRGLLAATLERPAHLGCFGLHEWAMVYKLTPGQQRHEQLPLRLGQEAQALRRLPLLHA